MSTESSTTEYNRLPPADNSAGQTPTTDVAKDQASNVASSASSAGQHVAGVAKDQAGNVAAEASRQAKDVVGQARAELTQQAVQQQQRVAEGLRSIGTELSTMADRNEQPGLATDLARQASTRAHEAPQWLEQREPSGLLDEVKTFARRRPGAFLAIALGAGLAAGRLTRGLKDESSRGPDTTGRNVSYGSGDGYPVTPGIETAPGYAPAPAVSVVEPVVAPEYDVERPYSERPYTEQPYTERPYTETSTPPGYPESGEPRP